MTELPTMTVAEASRLLEVNPRTLCKYAKQGLIRYHPLWSRKWVVDAEDVAALVSTGTTGARLAAHALVCRLALTPPKESTK